MLTFDPILSKAIFIKRYKRFFMELEYKNQMILAHIANTGSMLSLLNKDAKVLIEESTNPKRKLKYSVQAIMNNNTWVGVNTMLPNRLIKQALMENNPLLKDFYYTEMFTEVKYGLNLASKIDFLLKNHQQNHFLEVKSVTLKQDDIALFPDAISLRAHKHVHELMTELQKGHKASFIFVVQREDVKAFSIAKNIDLKYYQLVCKTLKEGLTIKAFCVSINDMGASLTKELPVLLP